MKITMTDFRVVYPANSEPIARVELTMNRDAFARLLMMLTKNPESVTVEGEYHPRYDYMAMAQEFVADGVYRGRK